VNILQLRASHPALFYDQSWYLDEEFVRIEAPGLAGPALDDREPAPLSPPTDVLRGVTPDAAHDPLPHAVTLALLYVAHPDDVVWHSYLWTRDCDHLGQRVYVGSNGKGLEIHRHIHLTNRFGIPLWR
jgi:hypothetical protein